MKFVIYIYIDIPTIIQLVVQHRLYLTIVVCCDHIIPMLTSYQYCIESASTRPPFGAKFDGSHLWTWKSLCAAQGRNQETVLHGKGCNIKYLKIWIWFDGHTILWDYDPFFCCFLIDCKFKGQGVWRHGPAQRKISRTVIYWFHLGKKTWILMWFENQHGTS